MNQHFFPVYAFFLFMLGCQDAFTETQEQLLFDFSEVKSIQENLQQGSSFLDL